MMKKIIVILSVLTAVFLTQCGSTSYVDRLDVYGVGAGAQPSADNPNAVDETQLTHVQVVYTPGLIIEEQDVSETAKQLTGSALQREFSGEPKMLAAWLAEKQDLQNVALLIDKNGVVAWHGTLNKQSVTDVLGVEGYKMLGGAQRITFAEALEKYVDKEKTQKFKKDKEISFNKGFFDYGKEGPFVYAKLPELKAKTSDGTQVDVTAISQNGTPTLLIFFMSSAREVRAADILMGGTQKIPPQKVLKYIDRGYFSE